jgi:hypothetical protein
MRGNSRVSGSPCLVFAVDSSGVTTNHDSLNLRRKTNLSNRVELVNKALLSYQKSKDSIDAGPIGIVRRIEAKQAGILNKFEY